MKIEFENEEEARQFYKDFIYRDKNGKWEQRFIDNLKSKGVLLKSNLEITKDVWETCLDVSIPAQNYIYQLEKEIRRISNGIEI